MSQSSVSTGGKEKGKSSRQGRSFSHSSNSSNSSSSSDYDPQEDPDFNPEEDIPFYIQEEIRITPGAEKPKPEKSKNSLDNFKETSKPVKSNTTDKDTSLVTNKGGAGERISPVNEGGETTRSDHLDTINVQVTPTGEVESGGGDSVLPFEVRKKDTLDELLDGATYELNDIPEIPVTWSVRDSYLDGHKFFVELDDKYDLIEPPERYRRVLRNLGVDSKRSGAWVKNFHTYYCKYDDLWVFLPQVDLDGEAVEVVTRKKPSLNPYMALSSARSSASTSMKKLEALDMYTPFDVSITKVTLGFPKGLSKLYVRLGEEGEERATEVFKTFRKLFRRKYTKGVLPSNFEEYVEDLRSEEFKENRLPGDKNPPDSWKCKRCGETYRTKEEAVECVESHNEEEFSRLGFPANLHPFRSYKWGQGIGHTPFQAHYHYHLFLPNVAIRKRELEDGREKYYPVKLDAFGTEDKHREDIRECWREALEIEEPEFMKEFKETGKGVYGWLDYEYLSVKDDKRDIRHYLQYSRRRWALDLGKYVIDNDVDESDLSKWDVLNGRYFVEYKNNTRIYGFWYDLTQVLVDSRYWYRKHHYEELEEKINEKVYNEEFEDSYKVLHYLVDNLRVSEEELREFARLYLECESDKVVDIAKYLDRVDYYRSSGELVYLPKGGDDREKQEFRREKLVELENDSVGVLYCPICDKPMSDEGVVEEVPKPAVRFMDIDRGEEG